MNGKPLWYFAKLLELAGMVIVLVGLLASISFGLGEEGLKSMTYELRGLTIGGGLFAAGWILESAISRRR